VGLCTVAAGTGRGVARGAGYPGVHGFEHGEHGTGECAILNRQLEYQQRINLETAFGNEASMMHDHAWSEKLLLAALGLLILAAVAQIVLK
jgi:hypothetical protein